jgi:hypothetical protein
MTAQVKGFGCRPIAAVGAHAEGPASVRAFAAFISRSPDTATAEDLRRFQHHQAQTGVRPPSINSAVAALRFFFTVTLDRPDLARRLTIVREPRRLPAVPRACVGVPAFEPPAAHDTADPDATRDHRPPCPCCGGRMIIVEVFGRGGAPRGLHRPTQGSEPRRHDTRHYFVAPSPRRRTQFSAPRHCYPSDCEL